VSFPSDFTWGVATSAHQIEGGMDLDGGGRSIWDTFAETPGKVRGGDRGVDGVDHRRRMAADVALMADLGIRSYRFSVAWPRVQPGGKGPANQAGLDFYRALIDELHSHGMEALVTLYHWDLPQELEDAGGWPVRPTAQRFAEYAALVGEALGEGVAGWRTVNEPWCAAILGYSAGVHAPGRTEPAAAVAAAHHLLLGHGLAVDALRSVVPTGTPVGITLNPYPVIAAGDRDEDRDAARRVDGIANRIWLDPLLRGTYPDDVVADLAPLGLEAHIQPGDLEQISRPIDALGLNYYRRHHARSTPGESAVAGQWPGSPDVELVEPPGPHTDGGWAVEPDGLVEALHMVAAYDPPPLYVEECGAAFHDRVEEDGSVDDQGRLAFLRDHIAAAGRAIDEGIDLRGWFVWTLLDNFEWAEGYAHRFGIVHVDFETFDRTPKASALWYAHVARTGRLP
jgi:beta-glucosidase